MSVTERSKQKGSWDGRWPDLRAWPFSQSPGRQRSPRPETPTGREAAAVGGDGLGQHRQFPC